MKMPEPFFLHRWVEADALRARRFNNTVYLLIAAGFIVISVQFIAAFELTGTPRFDAPVIMLFFTLLAFSNMATVSATYPHSDNSSFFAETAWTLQAVVLYPWACMLGLASTVVMLAGALAFMAAETETARHLAAQTWGGGLLLSGPALVYRTLFSRPLG